ncbi:MAG: helix-turn-helix transcriptional regulator [Bacteroidota bacterium]
MKHLLAYDIKTGIIIRALREIKGIKQSEVAEAIQMSQSTYSKLEKGKIAISIGQLQIAATTIGFTSFEIFTILYVYDKPVDEKFTLYSCILHEFSQEKYDVDAFTLNLKKEEFYFILLIVRNSLKKLRA